MNKHVNAVDQQVKRSLAEPMSTMHKHLLEHLLNQYKLTSKLLAMLFRLVIASTLRLKLLCKYIKAKYFFR